MLSSLFWKKYFKEYDLLNILLPYQEVLNLFIKNLDVKSGEKILDAGSGTGNLSIKLEGVGAKVTAVDLSPEGLEIHKCKSTKTELVQHDLSHPLPFQNNYFDKICSNNTIYTLSRDGQKLVLGEFFRVIKSGGTLVISNPRRGFSPVKIYLTHIKLSIRKNGLLQTVLSVIGLLIPTLKIFYYNVLIKRENRLGNYSFFDKCEQKEMLEMAGFVSISNDIETYAKQAIMNTAKKP